VFCPAKKAADWLLIRVESICGYFNKRSKLLNLSVG